MADGTCWSPLAHELSPSACLLSVGRITPMNHFPPETPLKRPILLLLFSPRLQLTSPAPLSRCPRRCPGSARAPPRRHRRRPAGQEARGGGHRRYSRRGRGFPRRHSAPLPTPPTGERLGCPPGPGGRWYERCQARASAVPGSGRRGHCPARCSCAGRRFCGAAGGALGAAWCSSHQQLRKGLCRVHPDPFSLVSQCQGSFRLNISFRELPGSDWAEGNLGQTLLFCCCWICWRLLGTCLEVLAAIALCQE